MEFQNHLINRSHVCSAGRHWFRHLHILQFHLPFYWYWYWWPYIVSGGIKGGAPGAQFFCFDIQILLNVATSGVGALYEGGAPYGNSWIHHCVVICSKGKQRYLSLHFSSKVRVRRGRGRGQSWWNQTFYLREGAKVKNNLDLFCCKSGENE